MDTKPTAGDAQPTDIQEGEAQIQTHGHVFVNPVQEFNRDMSISVLSAFARIYAKQRQNSRKVKPDDPIDINIEDFPFTKGQKYETGLNILEALSATGLRSIRYAKEIPGVNKIIANDISKFAVEDIKKNIERNNVQDFVTASHNDATMLMYQHKTDKFDAIDLDPYGSPQIFLDSAVQAVKDGGLLLVTATDMAVLAGNSPEACFTKYGAVSLKIRSCHEMALRILLQTIETFANRYSRYIVPQLSLSADFYIRVFVRVYSGAYQCKFTTSKMSMVHNCTGCDSFVLQPLGKHKTVEGKGHVKFGIPTGPFVGEKCDHCGSPYHMGGPIWTGPMHNPDFVQEVLNHAPAKLGTYKRILGVLSLIREELHDVPLYYTLAHLSGTLHCETPPMMTMRSAILNAGYRVSHSHCNKTSIKADAPAKVLWDIMRTWIKKHPVSEKRLATDKVAANILAQSCAGEYSLAHHPDANPESRQLGITRFQHNPTAYWGPGFRATAMVGQDPMSKSKRNQGKRKRTPSHDENSKNAEDVSMKPTETTEQATNDAEKV